MLYVPRDNYTTEVRMRVQQLLLDKIGGESCEFNVLLNDSPLARIHFIVRLGHKGPAAYQPAEIEAEVAIIAQRWPDELRAQLLQHSGEERGSTLYQRYQRAFPAGYMADFAARVAVYDIDMLEQAERQSAMQASLAPASSTDTRMWRLKLFNNSDIAISDYTPLLENMGVRVLDERPYVLRLEQDRKAWIIDIGIQLPAAGALEDAAARDRVLQAFRAAFANVCESDPFNKLVLQAELSWRDVVVLRAYARYLKQINLRYAIETLADCLLHHADIARDLSALFHARLSPEHADDAGAEVIKTRLQAAISALPSVDEEKNPDRLCGRHRRHAAYQPLSARCPRPAQAVAVVQAGIGAHPRHAAAGAAV